MDRLGMMRLVSALLLAAASSARAEPVSAPASPAAPAAIANQNAAGEEIKFSAFLAEVAASNLDYAAQRYNVPIAEAQVIAARVSPNPVLAVGTSGRDVTDHGESREPANNSFGLTQTIELAGKRGKRVAVARANLAQTAATLEDFFRTLRGTAAGAFIDALTNRRIAEEKKRSAEALDQLAAANRKRLEVGDVGETDVTQSRVDALQFRSEFLAALSDAQVAAVGLEQLLGRNHAASPLAPLVPVGSLEGPARALDEEALVQRALASRPDVIAARRAFDSARASLELAKAMRVPDVDLGFTYQANQRSHNDVAPAPSFSSIGLSLSLPVPLWNRHRGELEAARQAALQAEAGLRAVEVRARVDVRQAMARYRLANERVTQFVGGALADAAAVYKAKLFSYEHGATTLLDVLNAQKTEHDVRLAYLDALAERAKALVAAEQAAGTWDIDF
ncbi:MAG TPA: TolC family protein [Thermoanaerobaculia bacterium]|nr:TolC family protein [Thermoanaerobaculia bacterium]